MRFNKPESHFGNAIYLHELMSGDVSLLVSDSLKQSHNKENIYLNFTGIK